MERYQNVAQYFGDYPPKITKIFQKYNINTGIYSLSDRHKQAQIAQKHAFSIYALQIQIYWW
jgi:hypothetical protein